MLKSVTLRRVALFALASFLFCHEFASAQDYRGKIQGLVTDPSQAALAQASVTLKNINTGIETVRETDGEGRYLFDFVIPGDYSITVSAPGFQKFVQEKVTVLTRGDVTVNAVMSIGAVTSNVEVNGTVAAVEFNTSTMTTTIESNMVQDLPVLARNPFTLALLNPAVVNQYWDIAHRNPFYMWSNGGMNIGGPTGGKNDQEMDGTTLNISARGSYNAPMDTTQEVAVQQNAMDAEFGFSAGGTINLSTKSGTNDFHGGAYYLGRNPAFDALTDRTTRDKGIVRSNIWGFSVGNPVIKNKLFNFFNYEKWNVKQPSITTSTVPTAAEKTGDFSSALNKNGAELLIYDPFSTVIDSKGNATRTPFTGNKIPTYKLDPTGVMAVGNMWAPNNAGTDPSGLNNFQKAYPWWENYWNLNDRADYNINEKWRLFGRFSKFQTRLDNPNWGGTIAVPSANGGIMDAMNAMTDVLYMMSPRTTINVRLGVSYMEDDYASGWAQQPESLWASFWPNNSWYKNVLNSLQGIYYPNFNFGPNSTGNGSATAGIGSWWLVHGRSYNPTINITHQAGKHTMKAGWQMRYSYDQDNAHSGPGGFNFSAADTGGSNFLSNSATSFDPSLSGSMYASALLGVVNSGNTNIAPNLDMRQQQWGLFFQDDVKVNRNLTLNLGLRWERETGPEEQQRQLVQTMNLDTPIPGLQNIVMPAAVTAFSQVAYKYDGAMIYTSNSNPRMYDAPWNTFLPRAGFAYRLNDKMSIRAGYSRYAVPWVTIHAETGGLPTYGFSQQTNAIGPVNGIPQTLLSNPYPSTNPVQLPVGASAITDVGNYTGSLGFWRGNALKTPLNDRLNFNFQRQAMEHLFTEATFFIHYGHNVQDGSMWGGSNSYNVNQWDPRLLYQYGLALDTSTVTNPFYGLPASIMPGNLTQQATIPATQLLRQYPQYGDLNVLGWPGGRDHYYGLAIKAERPMTKGFAFMFGYNYNQEFHTQYFNDVDKYTNTYTMLTQPNPRHNFSAAGTWEIPVGRGRTFLGNANKIVDGIIGGWATSQIFMAHGGQLLKFNQANVVSDPRQNVPAGRYFNPYAFQTPTPYTARTNPWYYSGLRGPSFWQLDSTAVKYFPITEKIKLELRFEFFNMPNVFIPGNPDTTIAGGSAGISSTPADGNYGREIQYSAKIHF